MRDTLRLGTRDARLYFHAGMIQEALGDRREAIKYLRLALQPNASVDARQAAKVRGALATLQAR